MPCLVNTSVQPLQTFDEEGSFLSGVMNGKFFDAWCHFIGKFIVSNVVSVGSSCC